MNRLLLLLTLISTPALAQWTPNVETDDVGGSGWSAESRSILVNEGGSARLVYTCVPDGDPNELLRIKWVTTHDGPDNFTGETFWRPRRLKLTVPLREVFEPDTANILTWIVFVELEGALKLLRVSDQVRVKFDWRFGYGFLDFTTYEFNFSLVGAADAIDATRKTCLQL